MIRNSFAAAFAAIVIAGMQASISSAAAGTTGSSADESAATSLADAATQAGTAAGIVSQCHSDAAPIQSAFVRALDNANLDAAHRQSLLQRYQTAETSTLSALANQGAISCADTNGIIQNTIHELERPLS
jgi:hypothetical protein